MDHGRGIEFEATASSWKARSASKGVLPASLARAAGFLHFAMRVVLTTVAYASGSVVADDEPEPDSWKIFSADSDSRISALALSDDGSLLAVGGDGGEVVIVNFAEASAQQKFQAADDHRINAIVFLADDQLAVGDDDGRLAVWRLADEPVMESHVRHPKWITSLAATADKRLLIAADATRTVRLYELPLTPSYAELTPQSSGVKHVAFSVDGQSLLTSSDRSATVWAVEHLKPLRELKSNGVVRAARFTPDGNTAITVSEDGAARIWNAATGERKRSLTGHAGMVWCLDISPDGTRVATGGFDQTVRVWEIESGKRLHIFRGPATPVISVQWSRDGNHLFVAGEEQILRRFSLTTEPAP